MTQSTLRLNCLVFGDDIELLFTISIANTGRVCDLQEAVRKKSEPELDNVPVKALKLWKVAHSVVAVNCWLTTPLWQVNEDMDGGNFENWFENLKLENANGVEKLNG
jgi:hypothetical protein